ncbi:retropepsin-like aspartic protease family protein [Tundrisphaera sp. TA3]|uniref:retropepsin-like aspartic protease family protein n=1 Tax=Tundrisphaera sp. TA3 TaxID=3435775 RepID=UPI003EBE0719
MRPLRHLRLPGLAVAFGLLAGWAVAEDTTDLALREKGLRKSGSAYILPGEAEAQKKLNEAKSAYKQMTAALSRQFGYDQELRDSKQSIREMTQQRIQLTRQISQMQDSPQKNQYILMYNNLGDQLNLLNQQQHDEGAKREIDGEAATRREAYVQQILDLRTFVDAVTAEYATLAEDPAVKGALDQINAKSKAKATLGPSRAFLANVALLEKAESSVLSESVDLRKEGGIFWVDVTFNGKTTRPMAFDTGASEVTLPGDFAASIGLTPGPDDPVVRCQVADGSVIEARRMIVPSMRVGKFTVKDVSCVVMPADKKDVPPLLGQSFQKNFLLKFSPDTGKLGLSRVEAPEVARAPAKSKATAKRPGR